MTIHIRPIETHDVSQAYQLLSDLIAHENVGRPLRYTSEDMKRELFKDNTNWYGLVVTDSSDIVGLCLYTISYTNRPMNSIPLLHIDDFYIHPDYRNKGIGKQLLLEVGKIAQNSQISRIEVWCIKDNVLGQTFYQQMGAEKLSYIDIFRFDTQNLLMK